MRRLTAMLVLGLAALALSVAAPGASVGAKNPPAQGIEPIHTAMWPSVAAQLAKNIARASFAHQYSRVWGYLDPTYRKAISQSHWHRCQGAHPAAPRSVTITNVAVSRATELPIRLSLLGRQNVQEIELLVRFKTPAAPGPQLAVLYTFWLKQGDTWTAVWPSEEYAAYKAGKCYVTPQGPALY
jgi:hypothetical protein